MTIEESTIGTGARDYANFQLWETAKDENLVKATKIARALAYDDSVIDSYCVISNWSTSSDYYIEITAAPGEEHYGIIGTGVRIKYTGALGANSFQVREDHVKIRKMTFYTGSASLDHYAVSVDTDIDSDSRVVLSELIIDGEGATNGRGLRVNDADATVDILNCLIFDVSASVRSGLFVEASSIVRVYQCTFSGNDYGIKVDAGNSGDVIVKNCAAFDNVTADFDGTFDSDSCNNASSDTTAPGSNSLTGLDSTDCFVSSIDFNLLSDTSPLFGAGFDISQDPDLVFYQDIAGHERAFHSIGAYEYYPEEGGLYSDNYVEKFFNIFGFGLNIFTFKVKPEDKMIDIGDRAVFGAGNPEFEIDKSLVVNVTEDCNNNTVTVTVVSGGFLYG